MIVALKKTLAILIALAAACLALPRLDAAPDKPSVKLAKDPRYIQALRALDEGIPQVSIENLNACLAGKLAADDRALASYQLARAFLSADRADDALKALSTLPPAYEVTGGLLKAQALASLGRWSDAYPIYQQLAMQAGASPASRIGEAECLHAMGRTPEAVRLLEPIASGDGATVAVRLRLADFYIEENEFAKCEAVFNLVEPRTALEAKGRKYLEGRLLLAKRDFTGALAIFNEVLNTRDGLTENVMTGATMGAADALLKLQGPEVASNLIEHYIATGNAGVSGLEILFRRLDEIYASENPSPESALESLATATPPDSRSTFAAYYLAKAYARNQKAKEALETLDAFIAQNSGHPLFADACLLRGQILMGQQELEPAETRDFGQAIKSFEAAMQHAPNDDFLAGAEMWCANAYFEESEFVLAQGMYRDAAGHSQRLWAQATFNSALAWLNQANYGKFWADYQQLSAAHSKDDVLAELILDEGLLQAKSSDPRAEQTLREFVRNFPNHPRVAEARLALAEIVYLRPLPDLDMAAAYLKASNESQQSPETAEHAEYLGIFLADAAGNRDEEKVIKECQDFIRNHPSSPLLANVYMKLGQVYFRRGEWTHAEEQFETLNDKKPDSPLAEAALFLAGQAALKTMNTDKALANFDKVGKGNGPLKLYARQQQAIIESSGHEADAIRLYDYILAARPDPDLKYASLAGKADLCFLLGIKDPKYYGEAIATYDELAKLPDVTSNWRDKALYGKGRCYEKLEKPEEEVLAVFYDVIQPPPDVKGGPEYFWFYKAGFEAARILEDGKQWKEAIAIYKKMAAFKGPRSDDAKAQMTRIQMQHFIFDD